MDYPTPEERCKNRAMDWLRLLRTGTRFYENYLQYLANDVRNGGFTLSDIGTSDEELERLRVMGCKAKAQHGLSLLRRDPVYFDCTYIIYWIREELASGNLSLSDINTTEEEFASILQGKEKGSD